MKVLIVNKFFFDKGGDTKYTFGLRDLLESKGHQTIIFSMKHPRNRPSIYTKYFVDEVDYAVALKKRSLTKSIKVISRSIYSFHAKRRLSKLLNDTKPDIAHLQNIHHQITPAIIHALKGKNVPVVWTLHDGSLLCPNAIFLNAKGELCEKCKGNRYFNVILNRCKKGSLAASCIVFAEVLVCRLCNILGFVDFFITPSVFLREKMVENGFDCEKLVHIINFVNTEKYLPVYGGDNYYVYFGRLSKEKGVRLLIDAALTIPEYGLKIVGDGPMRMYLKRYIEKKRIRNISLLGFKTGSELEELIQRSSFSIFPSQCYENMPYSIMESFAYGKPVIGTRLGGVHELIKDNETGLTFESGNVEDLRSKIKYLINNPAQIVQMGKKARRFAEEEFNLEKHYTRLMKIYQMAIEKHK